MKLRLLVCGGRDFSDHCLMHSVLGRFGGDVILGHGDARGADRMAAGYADHRGWAVESFPADWKKHGKAAGPIRNRRMLAEFRPDVVVAFPGGKGTTDMIAIAEKAGVCVYEAKP